MIHYLKKSNTLFIKKLRLKYKVMIRSSKSMSFTNFLFQRIFRINASCKFQVRYTPRFVHSNNIIYSNDIITLTSFDTNGIEIGDDFLCVPSVKS